MTISAKARDLINVIDEARDRVQAVQTPPLFHSRHDLQYETLRLRGARAALEKYIAELEAGLRAPKDLLAALDGIGR